MAMFFSLALLFFLGLFAIRLLFKDSGTVLSKVEDDPGY
jgi:hypothetical protein